MLLLAVSVWILSVLISGKFDQGAICNAPTLTNPGQYSTTTPENYFYSGTASFEIMPFEIEPS